MSLVVPKRLYVFQTSRKLQNFLEENQNTLICAATFSEFVDKCTLVEAKMRISKTARVALLRKAARRIDMNKLGFGKTFLDFLSHGDFLFSFFEELRAERKGIDDIRRKDVYAAFEDHLEILESLFEEYKKILDGIGAYDFICVDEWIINSSYLKNFDEIVVESMGLFTAFELFVLEEAAKVTTLKLSFFVDAHNKKMAKKFESIGINIGNATGWLLINVSEKTLVDVKSDSGKLCDISAYRLKNRAFEAPFALSKVADFLKKGYEPEKIAIVLVDEGYAQMLKLFDKHSNLNFASGEPLSKNRMFIALQTLLSCALGEKVWRAKDVDLLSNLYGEFENLKYMEGAGPFLEAMSKFLELAEWKSGRYRVARELFSKRLYELAQEADVYGDTNSLEVGLIFASSIASESIDDVGGGKIKCIGVLEGRGAKLDAVVVLDMNEEFFPKKLEKDLFLNTKIKEQAQMPTSADRESLQKHFLYAMLKNVKECAFAFVENDESSPSPFLYELGVSFVDVDEKSITESFFEKREYKKIKPILFDTNSSLYEQYLRKTQKDKIGVTAFCEYLKCDKLFYFKHILGVKKEELRGVDETRAEVGSAIHKALETAFDPKNEHIFESTEALRSFVKEEALKASPALAGKFDFIYTLRQMDRFFENETKVKSSICAVETKIEGELYGVLFDGRIDRIDLVDNGGFSILDYKISRSEIKPDSEKTVERSHRYQLAIYAALLSKNRDIRDAYYYDLLRGTKVPEICLEIKLQNLSSLVKKFLEPPVFDGAKDKQSCACCEFSQICEAYSKSDSPKSDL